MRPLIVVMSVLQFLLVVLLSFEEQSIILKLLLLDSLLDKIFLLFISLLLHLL